MGNPCCCGCPLQKATRIIGIVDIILAIITAIIVIFFGALFIIGIANLPDDDKQTPEQRQQKEAFQGVAMVILIITLAIALISCLISIFLGWYLKSAADNSDPSKCRVWLIVNLVLMATSVGLNVLALNIVGIVAMLPAIAYRLWTMWVVYEYRKELGTSQHGVVYAAPPQYPV